MAAIQKYVNEDLHGDPGTRRALTKVFAEIYKPETPLPVARAICAKHNRIQAAKDRSTYDELISALIKCNPQNDKDLISCVRNSDFPFVIVSDKADGVSTLIENVEKTVCMYSSRIVPVYFPRYRGNLPHPPLALEQEDSD